MTTSVDTEESPYEHIAKPLRVVFVVAPSEPLHHLCRFSPSFRIQIKLGVHFSLRQSPQWKAQNHRRVRHRHLTNLTPLSSNYKTPKHPSRISNFQSPCPQFFTASKQNPRTCSSFRRRPSLAPSNSSRTKAVELEQSQSSRKVQIQKEQSLKSLAKSLTVENPKSCGCSFPVDEDHIQTLRKGKGKSGSGIEVRVDVAWRDPKRQRFRKCCSVFELQVFEIAVFVEPFV